MTNVKENEINLRKVLTKSFKLVTIIFVADSKQLYKYLLEYKIILTFRCDNYIIVSLS